MWGSRSISSSDVWSFYYKPSSVASYHGSAISVVMIRYRRSHYKEQWMVVVAEEVLVNHARTTSRNGRIVGLRLPMCRTNVAAGKHIANPLNVWRICAPWQGVRALLMFGSCSKQSWLHNAYQLCAFKSVSYTKQEAHHKVGLGQTRRRLIRKRCRYSSLEKFEDAFDTALDLMQTKASDTALLAVF